MFVNVDWFFYSHRLPIAIAAKNHNFDMSVYTDLTLEQKTNIDFQFNLNQSPFERKLRISPKIIIEFIKTFQLIKRKKPDLIHAVTIKPIIILGIISRITSTPFLAAFSGLGPSFKKEKFYQQITFNLVIILLRFIFKNKSSSVICQTNHDKEELIKNGVIASKKISLIRGSGVDINVFTPLKKNKDLGKFILMSSRMLSDKGVIEYCSAAKIVKKEFKGDIKFLLSGPIDLSSPTSISQIELDRLTLEHGVEYIGNCSDMPELLASAEIFVYPSYYPEGIPKVLIEALSCSVPIITTDHPGCRDVVINKETGILVPIKDPKRLAKSILSLLEDKKAQEEYGLKGRKLVSEIFEVSKVIKLHFNIYKKLSDLKISN